MSSHAAERNMLATILLLENKKKKKKGGRTFFQEVTHRQKYSVSILMRRGSTHQHFSYLPKYL